MRTWFNHPRARFFALLFLLLLLRVPFYFTHHVQEDAYISLRCAENLAETGVYGFNPGERVSASTSHLYVFLAALVRLLTGETAFIPTVLILNTLLFLLGTWFIARVLAGGQGQPFLLWAFLSSIPISLLTSYSGMETSLLVFVIGLVLYLMCQQQHRWLVLLGLALLPWIRPDAVAFALLLIFWDAIRLKKFGWAEAAAAAAGVVSLLVFNQLYFGAMLHQSISAKSLMRHPYSLGRFAENLETVFIGQAGGIFSPIRTKFFDHLGVLFLLIVLAAAVIYLWQHRQERERLFTGFSIASMVFAVPAAYAFGGVLYQWYFWPSAILGAAVLFSLLVEWTAGKNVATRALRWGIVLVLVAGVLAQLAFSYAWGMKEFAYRGGIGVWLKENAKSKDRILLEPAGYIPFYSGLFTYDEVGLVSPQVVHYREVYKDRWWPEFVMDYQPKWIIQRGHITDYETYQGYTLSEEEKAWFQENYQLIAEFSFMPEDFTANPFSTRLLSLGEADDYYIFKREK